MLVSAKFMEDFENLVQVVFKISVLEVFGKLLRIS